MARGERGEGEWRGSEVNDFILKNVDGGLVGGVGGLYKQLGEISFDLGADEIEGC